MTCSGGSPPSLSRRPSINKRAAQAPTRPIHPLTRSLTRVDRRHVSAQMLHEMATESARSLVVVKREGAEGGLKKGSLAVGCDCEAGTSFMRWRSSN